MLGRLFPEAAGDLTSGDALQVLFRVMQILSDHETSLHADKISPTLWTAIVVGC